MNRILFIGHEASRTGAPIVLLFLLQWLKNKHPSLKMDLLLLQGGELEGEYQKNANVYVIQPFIQNFTIKNRGVRYLKRTFRQISSIPFYRRYDLVIGNTSSTTPHLVYFKKKGIQTVCWLHELEYAIGFYGKQEFLHSTPYIDQFIAGSKAVKEMLIKQFQVDEQIIHLAYDFSKININPTPEIASSIKERLNIPRGAFIVGGCGTPGWRKGTDIFLQLAFQLRDRQPDIHFIWVGSDRFEPEYSQILYEIKRLNLEGRVFYTGAGNNFHGYFSAMDIFALTSREDPFPLVCLDAALLRKPIICFENAGGMPEFVENNAGAVVQYGDVSSMAEKIIDFYSDRKLLGEAGEKAFQKVRNTFSMEKSCTTIERVFSKCIELRGT